ncbi:hypothetical protein [Janibacter hoylei]|uniref:hypothetical protein n=1 Tax=Janibacter hoylei TaxID=364298 RepID=UPI0021A2AD8F|nr:hypothetical protein [Janibacter hoylei]MCT2292520.1 hypothetical protein [Janibacter hoylei]
MPPSHPRPEDLTALGTALSAAAESAATGGEALLDTMVSVGDHATQTAVDALVDAAIDTLRELSASCREISLAVSGHASPSTVSRSHVTTPRGTA